MARAPSVICVYASPPSAPVVSSCPLFYSPAAATWGERMEEVRASVPMHHSANTHAAPPPCRPTTCTTRGGDLPHPTCIDIPASPWEPGALRRLRPIGGGREGGIFLSGSSGWCWSAKQWGVEPRARHDLHLAWWGGRDGRGGVGMKGVASCTPTLQGRRCANTAVNAAGAWRAAGRRYARR